MPDFTAQRTLVKSPPELWSELSELDRLARHLDAFGEIRITRLEPESEVAWEGERASGTVAIEASGWGTKVTLTATVPEVERDGPEAEAEETEEPEPEERLEPAEPPSSALEVTEDASGDAPAGEPEPTPARRRFFARLVARWRAGVVDETPAPVEPVPQPEPEPEPEPEPVPEPPAEPEPPREPEPVASGDGGGVAEETAREVLEGVLDDLGAAHHRPFSRA